MTAKKKNLNVEMLFRLIKQLNTLMTLTDGYTGYSLIHIDTAFGRVILLTVNSQQSINFLGIDERQLPRQTKIAVLSLCG